MNSKICREISSFSSFIQYEQIGQYLFLSMFHTCMNLFNWYGLQTIPVNFFKCNMWKLFMQTIFWSKIHNSARKTFWNLLVHECVWRAQHRFFSAWKNTVLPDKKSDIQTGSLWLYFYQHSAAWPMKFSLMMFAGAVQNFHCLFQLSI